MPLPQDLKEQIQQLYSSWLQANNHKPRRPQREMIARIANFLGDIELDDAGNRLDAYDDQVCIVQAGTGTGKTLAYIIAALVVAKALDKKVIVSTATIALQEQLLSKDLPDLADAVDFNFNYAIAKGRSRYLCLSKLDLHLQGAPSGDAEPLFPDEEPMLAKSELKQLGDVRDHLVAGTWDGEYESLDQSFNTENWHLIAADRSSCSGKKCSHYRQCILFKARETVRAVDLVVANHDLTLADLTVGGGAVLPAPEEAIYVIDEAHHFPEKARNHLGASMSLDTELAHLGQSKKLFKRLDPLSGSLGDLAVKQGQLLHLDSAIQTSLEAVKSIAGGLLESEAQIDAVFDVSSEQHYRFRHGMLPSEVVSAFADLADCYELKIRYLKGLQETLSELMKESVADQNEQAQMEACFAFLGSMVMQLENGLALSGIYGSVDKDNEYPQARWLKTAEYDRFEDIRIAGVPLASGEILRRLLWSRCFAAVLTSATLSTDGEFGHFMGRLGAGRADRAYLIHGQLNFAGATFHVPAMRSNPGDAFAHTQEVANLIPTLASPAAGTLVLFSSRRQLEEVAELLAGEQQIFAQGKGSKRALIDSHKEKVDAGESSWLFGLASFAEGLDLPGAYCEQVIIAKLPFAVPDHPVDRALGEWTERLGGSAFFDISVPDAAIRLMQACGRLLRTEQDTGRVTLLDRRIVEKRYGKQLLAALPPFQLEIAH